MSRELRSDLGWALLLGALFAASPHSGAARPLVSLVGGGLVGGAVFGYRRWRPRAASPPATPLFARPGAAVVLLVAAFAALFGPTFVWLYGEYTEAIWRNGHGLFVPVFVALLVAERLRDDASPGAEGSAWGVPWLLGGAGLVLLDAGVRSGLLASVGFVLALPGVSLLLLGTRRTRAIAAPLALTVFLIPLPEHVPDPLALPTASAALAEPLLRALGFAVERRATIIVMRDAMFQVSANCSGVATLYAATFFAALLWLRAAKRSRRIAVWLAIWPATVAVNALRVTFLFAMTERYGARVIHSPIHGLSGIATFWAVMALLYLVAGRPALGRPR